MSSLGCHQCLLFGGAIHITVRLLFYPSCQILCWSSMYIYSMYIYIYISIGFMYIYFLSIQNVSSWMFLVKIRTGLFYSTFFEEVFSSKWKNDSAFSQPFQQWLRGFHGKAMCSGPSVKAQSFSAALACGLLEAAKSCLDIRKHCPPQN